MNPQITILILRTFNDVDVNVLLENLTHFAHRLLNGGRCVASNGEHHLRFVLLVFGRLGLRIDGWNGQDAGDQCATGDNCQ